MSTPTQDTAASPEGGARVGAGRVDPEAALVAKLRREEPDAPEQLVATFGDRVYRLAIRITGNEQDAEEVTQDALWTAARKIHTFKGESAFGSWLYRITANTAYQKLRGRQSKKNEVSWEALFPSFDELGNHLDPGSDWSAKAEEPALQKELREVLSAAIGELPDDYRTAFLPRAWASACPRSSRGCTGRGSSCGSGFRAISTRPDRRRRGPILDLERGRVVLLPFAVNLFE